MNIAFDSLIENGDAFRDVGFIFANKPKFEFHYRCITYLYYQQELSNTTVIEKNMSFPILPIREPIIDIVPEWLK